MARIISIVNQKGGTGKSACTANLAVGLTQKNMKVLIVDADPQSDVSAGFGYRDCDDSNETLTALMDAVMKDEDIPSDCYIRHQAEGIDIICCLLCRLWQQNVLQKPRSTKEKRRETL